MIADGDTFYAYTTNGDAGNMPVIRSADLHTWEAVGDAMPELATWVFAGRTWAPGVIAVDDSFIAYYTAAQLGTGLQCVGRAIADDPEGPFVDDSDEPLVCQEDEGGSIDASPFRRRRWLAVPLLEERRQLLRPRHVALRPAAHRRRPVADRRAGPSARAGRRLGGQRDRSAVHVEPRRPAVPVLFRQRLRLGGLRRRLRHV